LTPGIGPGGSRGRSLTAGEPAQVENAVAPKPDRTGTGLAGENHRTKDSMLQLFGRTERRLEQREEPGGQCEDQRETCMWGIVNSGALRESDAIEPGFFPYL